MAENILAYKLRTRFSPDMKFSQNHIANYGSSFKAQKIILPPLKCRIFRFLSKFVLFTQLSRKQIHISKIWLCHFLVYIAKYPYAKKIKNIHLVDPEKMCHRQTDRQTDRWTKEQNPFYRIPSVKMGRFDHVFQKFENKIFLTFLA